MKKLIRKIRNLVLVENFDDYDIYSTEETYLGFFPSLTERRQELWGFVRFLAAWAMGKV